MKCTLCNNELHATAPIFDLKIIQRIMYKCFSCNGYWITIDLPDEELFDFNIPLGKGQSIDGEKGEGIFIISSYNDDTIHLPWINISSFDDIYNYLKDLSAKYEMYVVFS